MSANLVVDVGGTCQFNPSLVTPTGGTPQSGAITGLIIDLKDCDTLCNIWVVGGPASGPVGVQVQTAEPGSGTIISGGGFPPTGAFTDPTSGLAQLPNNISSGGILWVNSGLVSLPGGGGIVSGPGSAGVNVFPFGTHPMFNAQGGGGFQASGNYTVFGSGGGIAFGFFQRPHRYARLNLLAGGTAMTPVVAGFLSNLKTTGSGGGFTMSPQTGTVNV